MPLIIWAGAMTSWLACLTLERAVWVRALAGDIVLCSWARHFTLTVPLSTQVYKWVPANCWGNLTNCGEVTCDGLASHPREVEILLAASCYRNRDKLRQLWASPLHVNQEEDIWSRRIYLLLQIPLRKQWTTRLLMILEACWIWILSTILYFAK